jgi:hypothetical protein
MHRATQIADRTIAVLSNAYLASAYAEAEWQEAWRAEPVGAERKLLVFRIEECPRPGLLGQLVSVDLFGIDGRTARSRLLSAVRRARRKPALPPGFPAQEPPVSEPEFPDRQPSSAEGDSLFRAMENMLRRYVQRLQVGQSTWDAEDAPGPSTVTRNDAIAAAYQLAGYIAATADPRVAPDSGAGAAHLMITMEYIAPQPADLEPGFKDALQAMVQALRRSVA